MFRFSLSAQIVTEFGVGVGVYNSMLPKLGKMKIIHQTTQLFWKVADNHYRTTCITKTAGSPLAVLFYLLPI